MTDFSRLRLRANRKQYLIAPAGHTVDALPANGNDAATRVRFEVVSAQGDGSSRTWEGTQASGEVTKPNSGSC